MSESDDTISTPHGSLDRAALLELENTYDTRVLLSAVEQLDKVLAATRSQDGLRDMLLRLHGMAQTVLHGAGLSGSNGRETLPELAGDIVSELHDLIALLESWVKQVEPLEQLRAKEEGWGSPT
jgi:hypothetical protein